MSGTVPINLGTSTLTVGTDNTSGSYSGAISGNGALVKTGFGTLTLASAESYAGATTVNAGKLLLSMAASLLSPVTVNAGGIFGGTGSAGSITVDSGGQIAPGNGGGALTLSGALALNNGAKLDFELGTPATSDKIEMASSVLTLGGQGFSDFTFTTLSGFGPGTYTLVDAATILGSLGGGTSGTLDGLPATISVSGHDVMLTITSTPEPSTIALVASWGIVLALWAWRRRSRSA
jgi:autotransporter-associated beta strand protein